MSDDAAHAALLARELRVVHRERNELLAALKWAMDILDAQNPCDDGCGPECSNWRYRALISRIEQ